MIYLTKFINNNRVGISYHISTATRGTMLFNSIDFLIFFPIVTLLYFLIPHRFRYIWLLIASYYFYMAWNPVYALLMLTSTFITYLSGILIDRANSMGGGEILQN